MYTCIHTCLSRLLYFFAAAVVSVTAAFAPDRTRGLHARNTMQMVHAEAPVPRRRALATIAAASVSLVGLQLRRCEACENMHSMQ